MSGHNKWSKIKRGKQSKDLIRGNVFSKLSRLITLAIIEGGGITDPAHNVKLRLAVDKAKQFNMPKDNIQRAVDRAEGPDRAQLQEIAYEAFAPGGVALIILVTTDNSNRTLHEVKNILERHQGKLGNRGSVSYLFERCGMIVFDKDQITEDKIFEFGEEMHASDIDENEKTFIVYFPYENLGQANEYLGHIKSHLPEIEYKPKTYIEITDQGTGEKILSLIEALETHDDVQKVFSNLNLKET